MFGCLLALVADVTTVLTICAGPISGPVAVISETPSVIKIRPGPRDTTFSTPFWVFFCPWSLVTLRLLLAITICLLSETRTNRVA
jgi:hypothetical protein